jgi:hypothetical protein
MVVSSTAAIVRRISGGPDALETSRWHGPGDGAARVRDGDFAEDFRAQQERAKFDKLIRFAERLPELRAAMSEHMELDTYERDRVSAVAARLVNMGWFRVGSDRYARESRTYGKARNSPPRTSGRGAEH